MRLLPVVLFSLVLAWSAVCVGEQPGTGENERPVPEGINDAFLDPDTDPGEWVDRFERESREIFAEREAITDAFRLKPGDRVADVGAGTGLFSVLFSKRVGKEGKVYALDISPALTRFMEERFRKEELGNIEVILSGEKDLKLPSGSVDAVFICDTYHHFEYPSEMLASIHRALERGGQLVVVDFERIPGVSREWVLDHVRAGKETFRKEIEEAGFRFEEEVEIPGLKENYFLRFVKP